MADPESELLAHDQTWLSESVDLSYRLALKPGDTILGMELQFGWHLTHGSKVSLSGRYFHALSYGLDRDEWIDYDQLARLAREFKPTLIIRGATAYPRTIDFTRSRFRIPEYPLPTQ